MLLIPNAFRKDNILTRDSTGRLKVGLFSFGGCCEYIAVGFAGGGISQFLGRRLGQAASTSYRGGLSSWAGANAANPRGNSISTTVMKPQRDRRRTGRLGDILHAHHNWRYRLA